MQMDRGRRNGDHLLRSGHRVAGENGTNSSTVMSSSPSPSTPGGVSYIEHHVSKMDTLAGVAIKYGVEVADIKRMNGLVTDLQMFALKSLQIPLPGRHPPSHSLSNGSATPGQNSIEQMPSRRGSSDVLESFQSIRLNSPQWKVSPAMSTLQGYYGLKTPNHKSAEEGTEMAVYRTDRARYLEDEELPRSLSVSDPPPSRHRKSRSLVNGFLPENGELAEDMPVAEAGEVEADKSGEKSVRRRQKVEAGSSSRTPERLLKDDNSNGSGFLAMIGKGLALRPKSASRTSLAADADSWWLNPIPVGLGDSLIADGFAGVRKSSSTSNLQEQDHNSSSSLWPTSKWSLRPDVQAGLPKPITGRRNKAALD